MRLLALLAAAALATGPGKIVKPIHEKKWTVRLYIVGFGRSDAGRLTGVRFAWIPPELEDDCLDRQFKWCERLPSPYYSEIEPTRPTHRLVEWSTRENREGTFVLNKLAGYELMRRLMLEVRGSEPELFVQKRNRVQAVIRWTLWPNGEGFRVLDIK